MASTLALAAVLLAVLVLPRLGSTSRRVPARLADRRLARPHVRRAGCNRRRGRRRRADPVGRHLGRPGPVPAHLDRQRQDLAGWDDARPRGIRLRPGSRSRLGDQHLRPGRGSDCRAARGLPDGGRRQDLEPGARGGRLSMRHRRVLVRRRRARLPGVFGPVQWGQRCAHRRREEGFGYGAADGRRGRHLVGRRRGRRARPGVHRKRREHALVRARLRVVRTDGRNAVCQPGRGPDVVHGRPARPDIDPEARERRRRCRAGLSGCVERRSRGPSPAGHVHSPQAVWFYRTSDGGRTWTPVKKTTRLRSRLARKRRSWAGSGRSSERPASSA